MPSNEANVILRGGPARDLPERDRMRRVEDVMARTKLTRADRYEHVEPSIGRVSAAGREPLAYDWAGPTCVAD